MNRPKMGTALTAWAIGLALLGTAGSAAAHGHWHHPHWGVGVYVGAPLIWPHYYYPYPPSVVYAPGYYPPATVIVRESPPAYVERGASSYWYYCDQPAGYYPYVKECQGTWRAVPPDAGPPPR